MIDFVGTSVRFGPGVLLIVRQLCEHAATDLMAAESSKYPMLSNARMFGLGLVNLDDSVEIPSTY